MTKPNEADQQANFRRLYDDPVASPDVDMDRSGNRFSASEGIKPIEAEVQKTIDQIAQLSPENVQEFLFWFKDYKKEVLVDHLKAGSRSMGSQDAPGTVDYFKWVVTRIKSDQELRNFGSALSKKFNLDGPAYVAPPVTLGEIARVMLTQPLWRILTGKKPRR